MARKVRRYMNNLYAKNSGYNEQKMMSMLPPVGDGIKPSAEQR